MAAPITGLPLAASPATAPASKEAERLQVLTLVQQFEGMLLTEMLRDVRAGDEDDEASFGFGGSAMNDMMQAEFGAALSRAGGLGMGEMLAKALARQQDGGGPEMTPAPLTAPAGFALPGMPESPRVTAVIESAHAAVKAARANVEAAPATVGAAHAARASEAAHASKRRTPLSTAP